MKTLLKYLAVAAVAAGLTISASAVPVLTIYDGVNALISISDNGTGDEDATVGAVQWSDSIGVWTINLDLGLTKPLLGSATAPDMDLSFVAYSTGAGKLWVSLSDNGFNYNGSLIDEIGGTTAGTVTDYVVEGYTTLDENLNITYGNVVASQGPFGPGAFSGTTYGSVSLDAETWLTIAVVIEHDGSGITTGDKHVHVPDGGMTALLLGFGLLGLAASARRLKK